MSRLYSLVKFKLSRVVAVLAGLALLGGIVVVAQAQPSHPGLRVRSVIVGRVVNFRGQPVRGALVRAIRIGLKLVRVARSGGKGFFAIRNVPPGRYRVLAFKRGIGSGHVPHPVIVRPHQVTHVGVIKLRHRHTPH